jgi:ATP-dependent phosphoenolpyruvate carboxykinase
VYFIDRCTRRLVGEENRTLTQRQTYRQAVLLTKRRLVRPVNYPLEELSFQINRERACDYLSSRERIYVVDGYAGWDPEHRLKIRVICSRPYRALFIKTMLIRPDAEGISTFGEPDCVIL